jgi:hypothetical protein
MRHEDSGATAYSENAARISNAGGLDKLCESVLHLPLALRIVPQFGASVEESATRFLGCCGRRS